jgi:hypothetical protein
MQGGKTFFMYPLYVRYSGVDVDILSLVLQSLLSMNIAHAEHSKRIIQYVDES